MLYEYAVEPEAIAASWERFRYIIEKFGYDRGRLISRFPGKWEKAVIDAAIVNKFGEIQFKKLVEGLRKAKLHALPRTGPAYDHELKDWVQNAVNQQVKDPFRAIIAEQGDSSRNYILAAAELDETHPLMQSPHSWEVSQVGTVIANAIAPLLKSARRVLFVDPYFNIEKPSYREALKACLDVLAAAGRRDLRCEIHFGDAAQMPPMSLLREKAPKLLKDVIPSGMSIIFYAWQIKDPGEQFHARYLLTDVGGVGVDPGFDVRGGGRKVQLSLLSIPLHEAKLAAFGLSSTVYLRTKPALVVQSNGQAAEDWA